MVWHKWLKLWSFAFIGLQFVYTLYESRVLRSHWSICAYHSFFHFYYLNCQRAEHYYFSVWCTNIWPETLSSSGELENLLLLALSFLLADVVSLYLETIWKMRETHTKDQVSHQFPSSEVLNRSSQSLSPCEKPPLHLKTEPTDQQLLIQKQFSTYFTAVTGHQHLTFLASSQVSELCILFYFLSPLTNKLVLSQLHKLYRKQMVWKIRIQQWRQIFFMGLV